MASSTSIFSNPDTAASPEYRPISRLAIVSLCMGFLSPLALVSYVLWIVPIVAACVSLLALRSIRSQSSTVIGRNAALVGLSLALVFGTWAPAKVATLRVLTVRQSREFAEQWLNMLRNGRLMEAHQLTLMPERRLRADITLEEFYGTKEDWRERLDNFLVLDIVKAIAQGGTASDIRFEDVQWIGMQRRGTLAVLRYQLTGPTPESDTSFAVVVLRVDDQESPIVDWVIRRIGDHSLAE